jgi:uncharacterized membrane protein (DUF2068 family)
VARKKRPANRYELFTCAWSGHVLVGVGAREVVADDALIVRETDGTRWCRCLRCDAWLPVDPADQPAVDRVPGRDEIELPLRGPALRDRYVLRLIALDRAVHVVLLTLVAVAFLTFAGHDRALHTDYENLMNALNGGGVAASKVRGVLGYLGRAFKYSPTHLVELALIFLALAAVEMTEAVGLWWNKRWAEYLTFVVTALFIPYEIYEIALKVSILKVVALVLNILVVAYLLWAKRLFGLRGGHAAEAERKRRLSGWQAVEDAQPGVPATTSS